MNQQKTIKDIAAALKVSVSTVSRALRDAFDINPVTKEKVLNYAKSVNYEPNLIAQSLARKYTKIIGVIVPTIQSNYFSNVLCGMTDVCIEKNYHLMISQSNEKTEIENFAIRKLLSSGIDGLLVSCAENTKSGDNLKMVQDKNIPFVMFDRILKDIHCPKVIVDEYEGVFKAVEYLIKKGCRNIAHIGGPTELSVCIKRKQGYLDALTKYNLEIKDSLIAHCKSFDSGISTALAKIMKADTMPDGIFCINDWTAIQAIKILKNDNIEVPEQIKVIGFNNDPVSQVCHPSLTTIMQPGYEVGKLAIGILLDEIEKKNKKKNHTYQLRTKFIPRQSAK